jgi:hypothetical protein
MRVLASLLLALCCAAAAPETARAETPRAAANAQRDARPLLTTQRVGQLKQGIALAGAALLAWGALARRDREPPGRRRLRDALLLGLGLAAALGWWNFLAFHHPGFGHPSETYHYYVGSKYFSELGYDRLYLCTAVADAEAGRRAEVEGRYLRDLERNELVTTEAALAHPEACRAHLSPERWQAFRRDITWFHNRAVPRRWEAMQLDHGYNATPVWTALGGTLANLVPATDAGILALRLIDPLLLAGMWTAIAFAFGWRAACVAALYWGTNYPAQYGWTGGSLLRQDWLVATLGALCALKLRRPATAGALLAVAIGLRLFPIFVAAAFAIAALARMRQARRIQLSPDHRRMLAGAAATGAALFALSLLAGGGASAWQAFIADSRAHQATPLRNHFGLATVVAFDPATRSSQLIAPEKTDPYTDWKQARRDTAAERRWLQLALLAGYLALLARVAAREEDWVVGVLGVGVITLAVELTCYYSAGLLAFGLLWPRRRWIGAALCALSALGWAIASSFHEWDETFTAISLASVLFIVWATASLARREPEVGGLRASGGRGGSRRGRRAPDRAGSRCRARE